VFGLSTGAYGWEYFKMKSLMLAGMAFVFFSSTAEAKIDGCYFVQYDAGVFARHSKLEIDAVVLQYAFDGGDEEDHDFLQINLRKDKRILVASILCKGKETKLNCEIYTDASGKTNRGTFVLTQTASGLTLDTRTDLTLEDARPEKTGTVKLKVASNPEHQHFTLKLDRTLEKVHDCQPKLK
jgi:hypothetical protein